MKHLVENYYFDASEKTITIPYVDIIWKHQREMALSHFLMITNVTRKEIIYLPQESGLAGILENNVLILDFDTTSYADTDELQIWVEVHDDMELTPPLQIKQVELMQEMLGVMKAIMRHLEIVTDTMVADKDLKGGL